MKQASLRVRHTHTLLAISTGLDIQKAPEKGVTFCVNRNTADTEQKGKNHLYAPEPNERSSTIHPTPPTLSNSSPVHTPALQYCCWQVLQIVSKAPTTYRRSYGLASSLRLMPTRQDDKKNVPRHKYRFPH